MLLSQLSTNSKSSAKLSTKSAFPFGLPQGLPRPIGLRRPELGRGEGGHRALLPRLPGNFHLQRSLLHSLGPLKLSLGAGILLETPWEYRTVKVDRFAELKTLFMKLLYILMTVSTQPSPPLQSSLNFQLLIRQSTVARSSVIKELN